MPEIEDLFANNRAWAAATARQDPGFFDRLSKQQSPKFMWIGCSDSRVPANQITGLAPGEMFVHRNVGNIVVHTDLNCLSVLQFAIDVLKVEHVIVCGHYGCGAVAAAYHNRPLGLADNWIRHIKDVSERHQEMLQAVPDEDPRIDTLCALNALQQAVNVCRTTVVQDAWKLGQKLMIHGLVYRLKDGLIRDMGFSVGSAEEFASDYQRALVKIQSKATL